MQDLILKMIVSLIIVVSSIIITLRFLIPKFYKPIHGKQCRINIVGSLRLNGNNQLLLLEVFDSIILVGVTSAGWNFIKEFRRSSDNTENLQKDSNK